METPHVVLCPFPAQGHIKPMFMLAELLSHGGINISFINTQHNQDLMLRLIDQSEFHHKFPNFQFLSIPDGLPAEHPRSGSRMVDLLISVGSFFKPVFKDVIQMLKQDTAGRWGPPTCIIADGLMSFAIDVAEELEIPVVSFRTNNASCTWVYFHLEKLIQEGEIPVHEDMDRPITCIPELDNVLRRRDLPSLCRLEPDHPWIQLYIQQTAMMKRASALILDTFDDLEPAIVAHLRSIFPKVYTIGPLHSLVKTKIFNSSAPNKSSNGSLRQEDKTCIPWLDSQTPNSVLYVSFGSIVFLSRDELLEFWYGLVNSGTPFLWVGRNGLIEENSGPGQIPEELMVGTDERWRVVSWAPQEEVLAHPAIGGFLTHSGWNSTLESIAAGVAMICWPRFGDQQVNSRCVSDTWKVGLDMKDTCDRSMVEKLVRDLMVNKREEIATAAERYARLADRSVRDGGSSYCNIEKLVDDLKKQSDKAKRIN